jgi:hypothetical protein
MSREETAKDIVSLVELSNPYHAAVDMPVRPRGGFEDSTRQEYIAELTLGLNLIAIAGSFDSWAVKQTR